jgi:hypothetical protein
LYTVLLPKGQRAARQRLMLRACRRVRAAGGYTSSCRATDSDWPIPSGAAGIAVTGQSGLVVEFDSFVLEELAFPSPSSLDDASG